MITAGKHKGKCFSFIDVGAVEMKAVRAEALQQSGQRRNAAITAQQHQLKGVKKPARSTEVILQSPTGEIKRFSTLRKASEATGVPFGTLQSCKQKLPWTFQNGVAAGWTLISKERTS